MQNVENDVTQQKKCQLTQKEITAEIQNEHPPSPCNHYLKKELTFEKASTVFTTPTFSILKVQLPNIFIFFNVEVQPGNAGPHLQALDHSDYNGPLSMRTFCCHKLPLQKGTEICCAVSVCQVTL